MARSALVFVALLAACLALAQAANLYDQLGTSGFTSLQGAIASAGLAGMFNTTTTSPKYTIFAPTNAAFAAVNLTGLTTAQIADILAFHVVAGDVRSTDLSNDLVIVDTNSKAKRINIYGSKITINGIVNIVTANNGVDIVADNGVIHTVDKVIMIPTMEESRTITAEVVANPSFSTLRDALTAASLATVFDNVSNPFTVFAPTNAAFNKLPAGLLTELLKPANLNTLSAILRYHVVAGTVYSTALSNNLAVTTLQTGVTATVTISGTTVRIDSAVVAPADLTRRNGVIHVIDSVIVPSNVQLPQVPSSPPPSGGSGASLVVSVAALVAALALAF